MLFAQGQRLCDEVGVAADAAHPPAGIGLYRKQTCACTLNTRRGASTTRPTHVAAMTLRHSDLAGAVEELDLPEPDAVAVSAFALREAPAEVLLGDRSVHLVDDEVPIVAAMSLLVVDHLPAFAVVAADTHEHQGSAVA